MQAVVTGGAGFIGSHVVDALLERGDDVLVVDDFSSGKRENFNPAATLLEHDIRRPLELEANLIFHLAAQADVGTSVERPEYDAAVNVVGTVNVLEAARRAGADVVFSSTGGAIYGDVEEPATEDTERRPVSPYGIAKLAAEAYVAGWNRVHGTRHSVLRFANVYGPRQDSSLEGGVVSIFLERMARGEETAIFGDGLQTRDFVHVADVVRAVLAAPGRPGVWNVGTGLETTVLELHALCRAASGSAEEPQMRPPRLGDARRSVLDASRAAADLGWLPQTDLGAGLRDTWDWALTQA